MAAALNVKADIAAPAARGKAASLLVGTSGWTIPARYAYDMPFDGTHLERYAQKFPAVEITTSSYRSHKPETYASWAQSVPPGFRFAVKLPRAITHERELSGCEELVRRFAGEVEGLGPTFGALLVQLPPSLEHDARTVVQNAPDPRLAQPTQLSRHSRR